MNYIERMEQELLELKDKKQKALEYLNGGNFKDPNPRGALLLQQQIGAMTTYETTLEERIKYHKNNKEGEN